MNPPPPFAVSPAGLLGSGTGRTSEGAAAWGSADVKHIVSRTPSGLGRRKGGSSTS